MWLCAYTFLMHTYVSTVIITVQAYDNHNTRLGQYYIIMITTITSIYIELCEYQFLIIDQHSSYL